MMLRSCRGVSHNPQSDYFYVGMRWRQNIIRGGWFRYLADTNRKGDLLHTDIANTILTPRDYYKYTRIEWEQLRYLQYYILVVISRHDKGCRFRLANVVLTTIGIILLRLDNNEIFGQGHPNKSQVCYLIRLGTRNRKRADWLTFTTK